VHARACCSSACTVRMGRVPAYAPWAGCSRCSPPDRPGDRAPVLEQHRANRPGSIASRRALLMALASRSAAGTIDFLPAIVSTSCRWGRCAARSALTMPSRLALRLVEISAAYAADQLMDSMSDGVLMIDRDGWCAWSTGRRRDLGIDRGQLMDRLPPATLATEVLGWQQLPFFPRPTWRGERAYVRRTAPARARRERGADARARTGTRGGTIGCATSPRRQRTGADRAAGLLRPAQHLPNRLLLRERFGEAIARAKRGHAMAATLFMDLDRFKQINDTLGTMPATCCSRRWPSASAPACARPTGCCARRDGQRQHAGALGGDEFVLLLSPIARRRTPPRSLAHPRALSRPFSLNAAPRSTAVPASASASTARCDEAETLMKKADSPCTRPRSRRNLFRFHDEANERLDAQAHRPAQQHARGLNRQESCCTTSRRWRAARARSRAGRQVYWRIRARLLPAAEFVSAARTAR